MSRFMSEATAEVSRMTAALAQYGTSYAMARASGRDPWVACKLAAPDGAGIPHDAQQWMRGAVERLVEERQRVPV